MKNKIQFCNADGATLFGFVNEISIGDDGWAMIAPLGDFPSEALLPTADGKLKRQRAIQRITKDSAETMVAQFHNSRVGLKKFIRGCNIYLGHPDMPGLENRYPDKTPKGVFADMEVRESDAGRAAGIYGLPVFTNDGTDLVEGRKLVNGQRVRGFSGRLVDAAPDGDKNGVPVFCPTKIVSAGLTAYPHLPVEFFNSDDTLAESTDEAATNNKNKMKKKLIALCATLGIQFANEADDAQTEAALDQVNTKVAAFANEATKNKTIREKLLGLCKKVGIEFANEDAITDPAATLAQVEDKVTSLTTERDTAKTQFANERADRIKSDLDFGVTSGRITAAERPTWENRLKMEAQFVNERNALFALEPKIKTTSITLTRGQRKDQVDISNPNQRAQFVNEIYAEIAAEQKLDPVRHSKQIQNLARTRHPALFDAPHVEIKTPGKRH